MFINTLVEMATCETNVTYLAQVTFKYVIRALLIHNCRLSFSQFEILSNLLVDKDGLYGRMNTYIIVNS